MRLVILLFLLLCAFSATHIHAQPPYVVEWEKTLGTTGEDRALSMLAIENNSTLIVGLGQSNRIYAVWLDANGNLIREHYYGAGGNSVSFAVNLVETHERDGYIIVGTSDGPIRDDQTNLPRGSQDIWILKIDKLGNKIWDRRYGGSKADRGDCIIQVPNGYLVAGITASPADGDVSEAPRNDVSGSLFIYDLWLILLDKEGNSLGQKRFGGDNMDVGNILYLTHTLNNNYQASISTLSGLSGDISTPSFGSYDYWILTFDIELNLVSEHRYGGIGQDKTWTTLYHNNVTNVSGSSWSGVSGNKTITGGAPSSEDIWIVQTDTLGNKKGEKVIRANKENGLDMTHGFNDGLLLFGRSTSDAGYDKTENCRGDKDFWLVLTDKQLNRIWDKTLGGNGEDWAHAAVMLPDNSIVIAGRSSSPPSGDKQSPHIGGEDFWVVKLRPENPMAATLALEARQAGRHVRLKWTLPEHAAGTCFIEREIAELPTGRFEQIGEITVTRGGNYEYIDALPAPGRSWYRLRWLDGGATLYSRPAEVWFNPDQPKPWLEVSAHDGRLHLRQVGGDRVQVYSLQGALVAEAAMQQESITLDAPAKGVYIVVLMARGQPVARQKMLMME